MSSCTRDRRSAAATVAIGLIIVRVRRCVLAMVCGAVLSSCDVPFFLRPPATPAPFCAPFEQASSAKLDFTIAPPATLAVSAAEAENGARAIMGVPDSVTTCSVRLARYDNLSAHLDAVWVVVFDGLTWPALGGPFSSDPPSPRVLRRAIVLMTTEAPTKAVLTIASGP